MMDELHNIEQNDPSWHINFYDDSQPSDKVPNTKINEIAMILREIDIAKCEKNNHPVDGKEISDSFIRYMKTHEYVDTAYTFPIDLKIKLNDAVASISINKNVARYIELRLKKLRKAGTVSRTIQDPSNEPENMNWDTTGTPNPHSPERKRAEKKVKLTDPREELVNEATYLVTDNRSGEIIPETILKLKRYIVYAKSNLIKSNDGVDSRGKYELFLLSVHLLQKYVFYLDLFNYEESEWILPFQIEDFKSGYTFCETVQPDSDTKQSCVEAAEKTLDLLRNCYLQNRIDKLKTDTIDRQTRIWWRNDDVKNGDFTYELVERSDAKRFTHFQFKSTFLAEAARVKLYEEMKEKLERLIQVMMDPKNQGRMPDHTEKILEYQFIVYEIAYHQFLTTIYGNDDNPTSTEQDFIDFLDMGYHFDYTEFDPTKPLYAPRVWRNLLDKFIPWDNTNWVMINGDTGHIFQRR